MGTLIDSSVIIAIDRGKLDWGKVLEEIGSEPAAISAITASELLQGVERASQKHRATREAFVAHAFSLMPIIPFDLAMAEVHARMASGMFAKGEPIGAHDLLIAATAQALQYRVLTRDGRSFPRIPDLAVKVI